MRWVTGRKSPFGAEDADQLRQEIMVGMPAAPAQIISCARSIPRSAK